MHCRAGRGGHEGRVIPPVGTSGCTYVFVFGGLHVWRGGGLSTRWDGDDGGGFKNCEGWGGGRLGGV